jgi:sec-independent protein translocase protein TatB
LSGTVSRRKVGLLGSLTIAAFSLRSYDDAMSFSETVFLFILALVVFGPKKLPEIARQAGKLLAELRRASNEFKSQIETEIDHLEIQKKEAEREKEREKEREARRSLAAPTAPPPGAVASMSLNPAPQDAGATLAAPAEATLAGSESAMTSLAEANVVAANTDVPAASVAETESPASQDQHV